MNNTGEELERIITTCDCHSIEHQIAFWYDEDDKCLHCEPHLVNHDGFFKRLWCGLKYAFGYKSKFGAWDDIILNEKGIHRLLTHLKKRMK